VLERDQQSRPCSFPSGLVTCCDAMALRVGPHMAVPSPARRDGQGSMTELPNGAGTEAQLGLADGVMAGEQGDEADEAW